MTILMLSLLDKHLNYCHKKLCGGKEYIWRWMAPHGRSGGVLLGVDLITTGNWSIFGGQIIFGSPKGSRRK